MENGVEAEAIAVEEILFPNRIVVARPASVVTEQRLGEPAQRAQSRLHSHAADVDHDPLRRVERHVGRPLLRRRRVDARPSAVRGHRSASVDVAGPPLPLLLRPDVVVDAALGEAFAHRSRRTFSAPKVSARRPARPRSRHRRNSAADDRNTCCQRAESPPNSTSVIKK